MKLASILLAICLLCASFAWRSVAAETFVHPAGAFQVAAPEGWRRIALVNSAGWPVYAFTPEAGADSGRFSTGFWVMPVPIPTDDDLEKDDVYSLAGQLMQAEDPGVTVDKPTDTKAALGGLRATLLGLKGVRNGRPWRGEMLVAIDRDSFLIVRYGCEPRAWEQTLPAFRGLLGGFVAPVKPPAFGPPMPEHVQDARDVSDSLTPSVPLIHIMLYENQEGRPDAAAAGGRRTMRYGTASGFVVTADGYVITNRHVVAAETSSDGKFSRSPYDPLELTWDQSTHLPRVRADVVGVSYRYDMALLKIADTSRKWQAVPLSDMSRVRNADHVMVMGWPDPSKFGETDVNHNEGTLTLEHDSRGRVVRLRHSARTTQGNSGGPLYDLHTGAVIGIPSEGMITYAHNMSEVLYHGTIPIDKVLWEFPQVTVGRKGGLSAPDRRALIAEYFLQHRFGAAVFECKAALADDPRDGLVNAYLYRIYAMQSAAGLAEPCLKAARGRPESRERAELFAARTALECDDVKAAADSAREVIRLAPDNPEGFLLLGEAEVGTGRYDAGEADLARAVQMMKGFAPEAEAYLGWSPVQQWLIANQVNKMPWSTRLPADVAGRARRHLEASYRLWSSRNWGALGDLGLVAGFSGDMDEAGKRLLEAINASGGDSDAILMLAYYQCLLSNADEALQFSQSAMDARETPRAHFILAWALLLQADAANKAGKTDEAVKYLKLAVVHEVKAAAGAPDAFWAPVAVQIVGQFKDVLRQ